jgi:hypothetical protein
MKKLALILGGISGFLCAAGFALSCGARFVVSVLVRIRRTVSAAKDPVRERTPPGLLHLSKGEESALHLGNFLRRS